MANNFVNDAKLVMVYDAHKTANLNLLKGNIDGIVSVATDPDLTASGGRNLQFANQCQWAYDLGVPFGMLTKVDFEYYLGKVAGLHADFPSYDKDATFAILDKQVLAGTTKRVIHFALIDIRDTFSTVGKVDAGWVVACAKHVADGIYTRYKMPWYILTDDKILTNYPNNPDISVYMSSDIGVSIQWGAGKFINSGNGIGYPLPDVDNPNAHVPFAKTWKFWWFGNVVTPAVMGDGGHSEAMPAIIFNGAAKAFYKEMGYSGGDPVTPPATGTLRADLIAAINAVMDRHGQA